MEKPFYNQGDLIQYRDSRGDWEVGVITNVFQVGATTPPQHTYRQPPYHKYAVTWTNHNQWGSAGVSETYNEEFHTHDIDENDYVTLLARGQ